jgi:putative ABC transport system permease protein
MFDLDKWSEIYATIRRYKLRTALTAFGVFWGIFMLIILLGAGQGFENGVVGGFGIAKNTVFIWSQTTSIPYKGNKIGRNVQLTNDDVIAIKEKIKEVKVLAPRSQIRGEFKISRNNKTSSFTVYGDYPDFIDVKPTIITSGRFINQIDIKDRRKVAIIGERVKELMFRPDEDPIGQYIKIKGVFFKVVGVFKGRGQGEDVKNDAQTIFIPSTALQQTFNQLNKVDFFASVPKDGVPAEVIEKKIKELLAKNHNVDPKDERAFGSANVEMEFQKVQGLFFGIGAFSWIVSIGTVLAGMIGVSNIMLIVVKERTKEIGTRKAIGATPFSIISLIMQESIVITAFAGLMGLSIGTGLVEIINYVMRTNSLEGPFFKNPEVNLNVALYAFMMMIISGAIAGIIPATKAARIHPVEALRYE